MKYKMTPKEYFRKIIELYEKSRVPQFYNPNIQRGRSASISSGLEDLTALFIALNNPNQCRYFTDQPMKFRGTTTKYPDIVIQNQDGVIEHLIDVKTDTGWNRDGTYDFCERWEKTISKVKGTKTSFKRGLDKKLIHGEFSSDLKYHVVVISKLNSGKNIVLDRVRVIENLVNVCLYILSDGLHPNKYGLSAEIKLEAIKIANDDVERLLTSITNRKWNGAGAD
jgi:hypothetical protein